MRKNLYLFTASFPFGRKENFIETEIGFLSEHFEQIYIYPFFYSGKDKYTREVPKNVIFEKPVLPINKLKRVIYGIISFAPVHELIREFFTYKVYLSWNKIKNWGLVTLDFCITIKSKHFIKIQNIEEGIFYFYWGTGWANILPYIRRKEKIKYFTRLHGGEVYLERAIGNFPFRKKVFDSSDFLLVVSDNLRKYLYDFYEIEYNKILVSRLGTSFYGTNPLGDDDLIRIVTCSNVILLKRLTLMVEILRDIDAKNIEWHHFGDGPELPSIKRKSKLLNHNIRPIFHGRVSNKELLDFYNSVPVDIFINLSQYEGIPVSIMEAMSFSIPCLATNAGATNELVDNDCGYLIDINFDISYVKGIILSVKSEDFKAKRVQAYLKWDRYFNSSNNYKKLCNLLIIS